jgi:mRNA-degrading endonuclease RelE of RelBE toxin-antitoxin system
MSYTISVLPSAGRDLLKLPARDWLRIRNRIDGLAENPRPYGSRKQSYGDGRRLSHSDRRILNIVPHK